MDKPAFLLAMCLALVPPLGHTDPTQMVDIGTHHLQMRLAGKGSPTVVVDMGIADQLDNWTELQDQLAQVTQVVTYNRAGYGQSEVGPLPRNSNREAIELKVLLERAPVPGPYVIVGHSLGGLNAQAFAAKYPEDVVGLVLLDPPPLSFIRGEAYTNLLPLAEQMTAEWQAIADSGAKSTDAEARRRSGFFQMIASEHREMFGASGRQISEIVSFGEVPLLVIAAGKPNPVFGDVAAAYQEYWTGQSLALSHKSTGGRFVLAEESTHHLYRDVPGLVFECIVSVLHQAREAR